MVCHLVRLVCTDIEIKAVLLVFVRYLYEYDVHEDLLCALCLPKNITASKQCQVLNEYFTGKLNWSFCVGLCKDGAAAMIGRLSRLTARIKKEAPECDATHCVGCQKILLQLHSVFNDVVKIIYLIKARALYTRLFEQICEDMDVEHKYAFCYTQK